MGTFDNVIKGAVDIYVLAYSATDTDPVASNAVVWTSWTKLDVQSAEGLSLSLTREGEDISVSEAEGVIANVRTSEGGTASVTLEQLDIELLQYAFAGTYAGGEVAGTNPDTFKFGGGTDAYYALGFEGEDEAGLTIIGYFPKVRPVGPLDTAFSKTNKATSTYQWQLIKDLTRTAGEQLGIIYRLTEAAE